MGFKMIREDSPSELGATWGDEITGTVTDSDSDGGFFSDLWSGATSVASDVWGAVSSPLTAFESTMTAAGKILPQYMQYQVKKKEDTLQKRQARRAAVAMPAPYVGMPFDGGAQEPRARGGRAPAEGRGMGRSVLAGVGLFLGAKALKLI